ncbi:hypothetical protein PAAG_11483 [Paracoccidioides lutzii Pb01]|uniref:Uncharacterized protein n=1 Tax=Paracoccidioides lutzii (strain ATCC MYA-826 / Pb01) TaxID=502779 RepID=A0A0A2V605_PARBA|nr:hypothetical protein PAAG_11483 [Paracoccidioides lutzii Pb01]KGQ01762.1 hypothetical protein PAAG_11483 [Paracoccidioides lutzii Pb01]
MLYNPIHILDIHRCMSSNSNTLLDSEVLENETGEMSGWIIQEVIGIPDDDCDESLENCFRESRDDPSLEIRTNAVAVFVLLAFALTSEGD